MSGSSIISYTQNLGPQRSKSGPFLDERMPQGSVTQNYKVNTYIVKERQRSADKNTEERRLGNFREEELNIFPNESLYARKLPHSAYGSSSKWKYPGDSRATVFSSFNAISLGDAMTQEEFEAGFKFMGFAKSPYDFTSSSQPKNGVSARVSGAGSTWNNGNTVFHPGDLVTWRLRKIDPVERRVDDQRLPKFKGIPRDKYLAILERYDHRNVTDLLRNALEYVLLNGEKYETDISNLDGNTFLDYLQDTALNLKFCDLVKLYNGVLTLSQYGLVTINAPSNTRPLEASTYRSWDAILSRDIATINKHDVKITEVGRSPGTYKSEISTEESDKAERSRKAEFFGYKIGVLGRDAIYRRHLVPSHQVVDTCLARMNAGLLKNMDDKEVYTVANFFDSNARKRLRGNGTDYDMSTTAGVAAFNQESASIRGLQAWKQASDYLDEKIVGRSIITSGRGEKADIVQ